MKDIILSNEKDNVNNNSEMVISYSKAFWQLCRYGIWGTLSMTTVTAGNYVSTIILSDIDENTLAASGLISGIQNFIINTSGGYIGMMAIYVGGANKKKNFQDVGLTYQQGVISCWLVSIPVMAIMLFSKNLLDLVNQPREISAIVGEYFTGAFWGIPAAFMIINNSSVFTGLGYPSIQFFTSLVQKALTVSIGYCFVFGKFSLPKMGVIGLGHANSIANWLTFVGQLWALMCIDCKRPYAMFNLCKHRGRWKRLWQLIKKGVPVAIRVGNEFLSLQLFAFIAGWLGNKKLIATELSTQYLFFAIIPGSNLAMAGGILIKHYVAQKKFRSAERIGNLNIALSVIVPSIAILVFIIFPRQLLSPFIDVRNPDNNDLIALTQSLFLIASGGLLDSLRNTPTGNLKGFLDTCYAMGTSLITIGLITMPLSIILGFATDLDIRGVFIARDIGMLLGITAMLPRWFMKASNVVIYGQKKSSKNCVNIEKIFKSGYKSVKNYCCSFFSQRNNNTNIALQSERTPLLNNKKVKKNRCGIM